MKTEQLGIEEKNLIFLRIFMDVKWRQMTVKINAKNSLVKSLSDLPGRSCDKIHRQQNYFL